MYGFLLRPRWLAWHAGLVAVLVAFVLLGRWQLSRYEQADAADRASHQSVATAGTPAPAPLDDVLAAGTSFPVDAVGRPVTVGGRYDAAQQLLVPDRRLAGRTGYYVLTPLVTPTGDVVVVRRGWVAAVNDPATAVPAGRVTVVGALQPSETTRGTGRSDAGGLLPGQVPLVATAELMSRLPYPPQRLYEGYLALTAQQPAAAVAPAPVPVETRSRGGWHKWQNLSYVVQWWLFAGAAVFFWFSAVRGAVRDRRRVATPATAEPVGSGTGPDVA